MKKCIEDLKDLKKEWNSDTALHETQELTENVPTKRDSRLDGTDVHEKDALDKAEERSESEVLNQKKLHEEIMAIKNEALESHTPWIVLKRI